MTCRIMQILEGVNFRGLRWGLDSCGLDGIDSSTRGILANFEQAFGSWVEKFGRTWKQDKIDIEEYYM